MPSKPEPGMVGWEAQKEKLLVMVVLDDDIGKLVTSRAGEAFFRAFVVENRGTGVMECRLRFRYTDHDSWFTITPKGDKSRAEQVADFEEGMHHVVLTAMEMLAGVKPPEKIVKSYYVPDDEGDPQKTVNWLLANDLMHITKIEEMSE